MDELGGLPAHPLLVHLPVVMVVLAAVGVVLLSVRPPWMVKYGPLVVAFAFIGFVGAWLAAESGEALEGRLRDAGETISGPLRDHVEAGDRAPIIAGLFFVVTALWIGQAWWRRRSGAPKNPASRVPMILTGIAVVAAIGAGAAIVTTGHSGAQSVWEQSVP